MLSQKFWKKYFQVYDVLNLVIPYQELIDEIIKEADVKDGDLILDAGCGTGNFELKLRGEKPELEVKVMGVDNSNEGLEKYKEKMQFANLKKVNLSEKLPFPDAYFDIVISNNVLYTFPSEKQIFIAQEFYRVLKPGGRVVVSNVKEGWAPFKIYSAHIRKSFKKNGFWGTISVLVKMFFPTLKMFFYNSTILREGSSGDYHFLKPKEQGEILSAVGFAKINEDVSVYADQAILNRGEK